MGRFLFENILPFIICCKSNGLSAIWFQHIMWPALRRLLNVTVERARWPWDHLDPLNVIFKKAYIVWLLTGCCIYSHVYEPWFFERRENLFFVSEVSNFWLYIYLQSALYLNYFNNETICKEGQPFPCQGTIQCGGSLNANSFQPQLLHLLFQRLAVCIHHLNDNCF